MTAVISGGLGDIGAAIAARLAATMPVSVADLAPDGTTPGTCRGASRSMPQNSRYSDAGVPPLPLTFAVAVYWTPASAGARSLRTDTFVPGLSSISSEVRPDVRYAWRFTTFAPDSAPSTDQPSGCPAPSATSKSPFQTRLPRSTSSGLGDGSAPALPAMPRMTSRAPPASAPRRRIFVLFTLVSFFRPRHLST